MEELDKARLTRGETSKKEKDPPFPAIVDYNVVEEVEADQGPPIIKVSGDVEVVDSEVVDHFS